LRTASAAATLMNTLRCLFPLPITRMMRRSRSMSLRLSPTSSARRIPLAYSNSMIATSRSRWKSVLPAIVVRKSFATSGSDMTIGRRLLALGGGTSSAGLS
jgi:hypothetical protein